MEGGRVCNAYLQVFACISHPLNVPPPPSQAGTPRPSGGEAVRMRGRAGLVRDSGLLPSSPPPRVAGGAAGAEGRWKSRVFSVKSERGASGRRARAAGRSAFGNAGLFLTSWTPGGKTWFCILNTACAQDAGQCLNPCFCGETSSQVWKRKSYAPSPWPALVFCCLVFFC